ncbi:hypothetical protein EWH84_10975 [Enterococcus faecium]|nr:hypothetical protein EWH84_10975 [Enterococcus faecium]
MFWKIKKMLVSSTNIKKYRAQLSYRELLYFFCFYVITSKSIRYKYYHKTSKKDIDNAFIMC